MIISRSRRVRVEFNHASCRTDETMGHRREIEVRTSRTIMILDGADHYLKQR